MSACWKQVADREGSLLCLAAFTAQISVSSSLALQLSSKVILAAQKTAAERREEKADNKVKRGKVKIAGLDGEQKKRRRRIAFFCAG